MPSRRYEDNVFINCPFDAPYQAMFDALVFAIHDAGFIARCAREVGNPTEARLKRIIRIIAECRYGIHDISRTNLDSRILLPRFNMPFELGLFLGCKEFGLSAHIKKACLVLDTLPYRHQRILSDIAGHDDVFPHGGRPQVAIRGVRDWLRSTSNRKNIPGAATIWERYIKFRKELPPICRRLKIRPTELIFLDFTSIVTEWLRENALWG